MTYVPNYRQFGNGAVHLRAVGAYDTTEGLDLDVIRQRVPSVFAEGAHSSRSERFTFIPTGDVLAGLIREGFVPVEVRQGGSRIAGKAAFTKHSVRLRQRGTAPGIVGVSDQVYPEIVISNAHDGTGAYVLNAGGYRVLCKNGLVASSSFSEQRVPHKGNVIDNVIEGVFSVVEDLPRITDQANEWAHLPIAPAQQVAFARAALQLRWQPEEDATGSLVSTAPIEGDVLNRARRIGDQGADVWRTFNRVQEGLLRGGQHYVSRNRNGRNTNRHVGTVNSVDDNRRLNQALWTLTEELAKAVA